MPEAPPAPSTDVATPNVAPQIGSSGEIQLPGKSAGLNPSKRIKGIVANALKTKGVTNPMLPDAKVEPEQIVPKQEQQKLAVQKQQEDEKPEQEKGIEKPAEVEGKIGDKEKKVGPWQLLDKQKSLTKQYEKENIKLKSELARMGDREQILKEKEDLEKRFKAADEELRFTNYSKSEEFQEKYEKPFHEAWQTAVAELGQVPLFLDDGTTRNFTSQDLLQMANMDPGQLTTTLKKLAPDFSDDIKAHIREVRKLSAAQTKALSDARKKGTEFFENKSKGFETAKTETAKIWNEELEKTKTRELLQQKEGDDEWNSAIQNSTTLIESAFKGNALDPRLTPEQRQQLLKDKVKMRTRALEAPLLKLENTRLKGQLGKVQKELDEIKNSGPSGGGGSKSENGQGASIHPMDRSKAAIRKAARPGD